MATPNQFVQTGTVPLAQGATSGTVTFPVAFINIPFSVEIGVMGDGSANIFATPGVPTANGVPFTLSGVVPNGNFFLTYTATSNQPAPNPPCPPSGGGCGCGGGVNTPNACPPPVVASFLFPGAQGQPGPLALLAGAYNPATVYYCTTGGVSVVSYLGYYFRANNPAKSGTATWGTPAVNAGDWLILFPVGNAPLVTTNSEHASVNITGGTVITPASSNHVELVTVTGAASLRNLTLAASGSFAGDRIVVQVNCSAAAGATFEFTNLTVGGGQLLPAARFPGNIITTAGNLQFTAEFVFDGTNWNYLSANLPS